MFLVPFCGTNGWLVFGVQGPDVLSGDQLGGVAGLPDAAFPEPDFLHDLRLVLFGWGSDW